MYSDDTKSQAQRVEALPKPLGRGSLLLSRTAEYNNTHEDGQTDPPGSSMKNIFSRTMSFKMGNTVIRNGRSMSQDPSSQLSIPRQESMRSSSPSSTSRVTISDSNRSSIARASSNPLPFFQAYPQALRYAILDSPCSSVESILRHNEHQNNVILGGSTTPTNFAEASAPQKKTKKHRRAISVSRKLFILVRDGQVLQYSVDGPQERQPEKTLQLGHHSVAFASDAIPGRPYVLQISRDPSQDAEHVDAQPKNIWSRTGFRKTEEKRTAKTLLMVCASPEELDAWMIAVRREIENHGGAPYRSGTPRAEHDQFSSDQGLTQLYDHCECMQQAIERPQTSTTCSDTPSIGEYEPLPEIKTLPAIWLDQPFLETRRSSADSSVDTATELDALRDSSQSCTSTAQSLDESAPSLSPANDKFSETYNALHSTTQHPLPLIELQTSPILQAPSSPSPRLVSSPKQIPAVSSEKHRLSSHGAENRPVSIVPNFSLPNLSQRYSRRSLVLSDASSPAMSEIWDMATSEQIPAEKPPTEVMSQRLVSAIAPLPPREAVARNPRSRLSSMEHARPHPPSSSTTPASSPSLMGHYESLDTKPGLYSPTPAYTAFPKRFSLDVQNGASLSPLPKADLVDLSAVASHKRSSSTTRLDESTNLLRVPQGRRMRRPASMQIEVRKSLDVEKPERSPAVTDMHFATNFGTADPFDRSSSILPEAPITSVPQLELVRASTHVVTKHARKKTASVSALGPPAGPPPTCPLPAPPSLSLRIRGSSVPVSSPRRVYLDLTTDDF